MKRCLSLSILSAFIFTACQPRANVEADREALRQADADYSQAAAAKDMERWASWYAADARLYPPNSDAMIGIDAVREFGSVIANDPGFSARFEPVVVDVSADGSLGYTLNDYVVTLTGPGGNLVTEEGPDFHVWRKQADGSWKIAIDMWNSDQPAP